MTPEQLQKTRAERWRQNGNALVTLEDAEEWLRPLGLCLFLPRRVQLATPAPSFVEACLGETNATPSLAAIENATALLTRLIDNGSVVPLNLLGISGEQPDFLVTIDALPYVYALRGDKDWKHEPATAGNGRVSPLVLGIWKALERTGVQTAIELRESMGKELTEAAILRGLSELWNAMRVIMLPGEGGEGATWELLKARYQKQMAAGAAISQVSALSVLLAQYLESAVGATSEEAEIFLSPLSSRSKVREVIRGLTATRQLAMIGLDGQAVLYVEGTLPEFEQPESQVTIEAMGTEPAEAETADAPPAKIRKFTKRAPRTPGAPDPLRWKRDSSVPPPPGQSRGPRPDSARPDSVRPDSQGFDRRSKPKPDRTRPAARRPDRPGSESSGERPSRPFSKPGFAARSERPFTSRPASSRPASARPPSARPAGARTFGKNAPGGFEKKPRWVPRDGSPSTGRSATARPGKESSGPARPYSARPKTGFPSGSRPPAAGGSRPYSKPAAGGFKPRSDRASTDRPNSDRPNSGRPSTGRPGTGRPFAPRPTTSRPASSGSFEKKPRWVPRDGGATGRPPTGRSGSSYSGGSKPAGNSRPFSKPGFTKPGFSKPGFQKSGTGGFKPSADASSSSRPFSPRASSSRPPSKRPPASRTGSSGGFEKKPRWVPREGSNTSRPGTGRAPGSRPTGDRPAKSFGDKPPFGRKPGFGARSADGSSRPSGPSGSSRPPRPSTGGSPGGKPGFGRKPGGKPSFGKRSNPGDFPKRKRPE